MVVAPYLINKLPPDSSMVKFVVTSVGAEPVILIGHVPVAPVPLGEGMSVPIAKPKFVLAAEAVDAFVPPLERGTGELSWVGGTNPAVSNEFEKLARLIACVFLHLSALLFLILVVQVLFACQQITLSCLVCIQPQKAYPYQ